MNGYSIPKSRKSRKNLFIRKPLFIIVLLIILLTLPVFGACGSGSTDQGGYDDEYEPGMADSVSKEKAYSDENYAEEDVAVNDDSADAAKSVNSGSSNEDARKEIKTGNLELSVKEVAESYKEVSKLVDSLGGYEFSKSEYQSTYGLAYDFVVKIPPAKLKDFEAGLNKQFGKDEIVRYALSSEDITADYNDTTIKLESLKKTHERFLEILKKAETVEDVMKVQREISDIEAEIDQAEGRIRMWDKLVEYATIDISITSNATPVEQSWKFETGSDVFNAMGNGFVSVARNAGSVLLWIIIGVVSALPVLIPAVGIVILCVWLSRRKKRQIAEGKRKPKTKKHPKPPKNNYAQYPPPNQPPIQPSNQPPDKADKRDKKK